MARARLKTKDGSRTAIYASIAANVAIAVTKFIVAGVSHSSAMLAEAVHSLVNCFDGALLVLGQVRSRRPADETHPFGYGRELYFWSLIVAILFFTLGAGVNVYEGIQHVVHPSPLGSPVWSYAVLAISLVFDGASFVVGLRQFQRQADGAPFWRAVRHSKNPAVFSVVLEDIADLTGLALAFAGVFLSHRYGWPKMDGIASIAIGFVLGIVATVLLVEIHGLILGEAARPDLVDAIHKMALEDESVRSATRPASIHVGPDEIVVALDVCFDERLSANEVVASTERLDGRIREKHPAVRRVFVQPSRLSGDAGDAIGTNGQ